MTLSILIHSFPHKDILKYCHRDLIYLHGTWKGSSTVHYRPPTGHHHTFSATHLQCTVNVIWREFIQPFHLMWAQSPLESPVSNGPWAHIRWKGYINSFQLHLQLQHTANVWLNRLWAHRRRKGFINSFPLHLQHTANVWLKKSGGASWGGL